jgi:hypothetical protein
VTSPAADPKRLGKRGAYRFGRLRAQGVGEILPPEPFRMSFAPPRYRGQPVAWLALVVVGTAVIAAGALAGLWWMPFAVGAVTGAVTAAGRWWLRGALLAVVLMALAGWAVPLAWPALHGVPVAGTARVVAALAGLPGGAAAGLALALLVGLIQALAGLWLGRTLARLRRPG